MNKLTALVFTLAFSFGGASTSFASNMNDQAPQTRDLSVQEMNSTVGAGRIYWRTSCRLGTQAFQDDGNHAPHQAIIFPYRWYDIGRHNIRAGQPVFLTARSRCSGRYLQARIRMPNYNIGIAVR